jgi:GNAT superfamily N-acetyltransferase
MINTGASLPRISLATVDVAAEVLELQKLCFYDEAELNQEFNIPPLKQTLDGLREDFRTHTVLAAWQGTWLVGSVRGRRDGAVCRIGRLIVHPDHRGRGLGVALMGAIEAAFPGVEYYEVFTGERSERNLRLYGQLGYVPYHREVVPPRLTLVYLHKRGPAFGFPLNHEVPPESPA